MSNLSRKEALFSLVNFSKPLAEIQDVIVQYSWDCKGELLNLKKSHLKRILNAFLAGKLPAREVELWANLIEGRDDIGFDPEQQEILRDALHELANPILTRQLTMDSARDWVEKLDL